MLTETRDNIESGFVVHRIYTYTYGGYGNKLTASYDYNMDGIAEAISTYTYNANGDSNMDGIPDQIVNRTYDNYSNITSYYNDVNGDGVPEQSYSRYYQYDGDGNILATSSEPFDGDEDPGIVTVYTLTSANWKAMLDFINMETPSFRW